MSARVATPAEQMPRRARYLVPKGLPRRGEILAACVVVAVLAHVLFAQLTLILAVLFVLITRATRWRLSWLIVPVVVAVAWTLAVGPRVAAAGFADGPAKVAGYLGAGGHQLDHALHFTAAFAGSGSWLPRQLPLAILAGAAEAAIIGWLSWLHTDEVNMPPARPGLLAAARRAATRRTIRAGGVVTRDGICLGVAAGSGARVTLSWPETTGGVSVCGSAEQDVLSTSFQLVHAAVRRRKPVIAVDLTADPALPGRLAAACAAVGVPLQVFGDPPVISGADPGDPAPQAWIRPACYEPFRHGEPGARTSLITAMISWDGPGSQYRRSCVAYLEDVFELIDAAPGDPRVPALDEVIHLLNPIAMRARMEHVPAAYPRRDVLAERTRVSASLLHAEPATTAALTRQLRELKASAFGPWLRPSGPGPGGRDRPRPHGHRAGRGPVPPRRFGAARRRGHAHPADLPGPAHGGRGAARDRRRRRRDRVAGRVRRDAPRFGHRTDRPRPWCRIAGAGRDHLRGGRGRARGAHQRRGGAPDG